MEVTATGGPGKPRLVVVTSVIRPENLPKIAEHLLVHADAPRFFDLRWDITIDDWHGRSNDPKVVPEGIPPFASVTRECIPGRYGERNFNGPLLRMAPDEWWWYCADDNLPAPGFFERLRGHIDRDPELRVVLFSCRFMDSTLEASRNSSRPGCVDMGQLAFRRDAIEELRFSDEDCPDGLFIERLVRSRWEGIHFDHGFQVYYNRLR